MIFCDFCRSLSMETDCGMVYCSECYLLKVDDPMELARRAIRMAGGFFDENEMNEGLDNAGAADAEALERAAMLLGKVADLAAPLVGTQLHAALLALSVADAGEVAGAMRVLPPLASKFGFPAGDALRAFAALTRGGIRPSTAASCVASLLGQLPSVGNGLVEAVAAAAAVKGNDPEPWGGVEAFMAAMVVKDVGLPAWPKRDAK